jgi:hypothetical protein
MYAAICRHRGDAPITDDLSMLAIQFNPMDAINPR